MTTAHGNRIAIYPRELAIMFSVTRANCWCDPQLVALDNLIVEVSDHLRERGLDIVATQFEVAARFGHDRNPSIPTNHTKETDHDG